jgi:hypothetical protein
MVALFDFQMSKFIVDIALCDERANGIEWLHLAEMVLFPTADDEKGLTDEVVKAELLTTTPPCFFSRFPTADSCCDAADSSID